MSGHSKWATTKRAKSVTDAKRSNLFTKLSKNITVAAKDGANPDMNSKLRLAVDKAKAVSMPKDNIERAIARGAGTDGGAALESALYEAYGPEGVAIIIEAVTDNKNRTVSNIKGILNKHNGSLGSSGSVLWQFERKGIITLALPISDEQELELIDWGADDILRHEDVAEIICHAEITDSLKQKIQSSPQFTFKDATVTYRAKDLIAPKESEKIISLLEALEDDEDVDAVSTNADV
jgi:YebC/PmpR family DNA-binding regulatory protein